MTDEEPVLRFLAVVNAGKVYGPYEWNGKYGCVRRPFWMWVAEGDDAWLVADRLWPLVMPGLSISVTVTVASPFLEGAVV